MIHNARDSNLTTQFVWQNNISKERVRAAVEYY